MGSIPVARTKYTEDEIATMLKNSREKTEAYIKAHRKEVYEKYGFVYTGDPDGFLNK